MSKERTIQLSSQLPTYGVCVVGSDTTLDFSRSIPSGAVSFDARGTSLIDVSMVYNPQIVKKPEKEATWPLDKGVKVVVSSTGPSRALNDSKVKVSYYGPRGDVPLGSALLYLTSVDVSLDVDVNRVGTVSQGAKDKESWTWGPKGKGAILLVNCDRDNQSSNDMDNVDMSMPNFADIKDMSPMILTVRGPVEFFGDHKVVLHVSSSDSNKLRVYGKTDTKYNHVLGGWKLSYEVPQGNKDESQFYVEGLEFPDVGFPGLVYINLSLLKSFEQTSNPIFTEKVVFKISPWIMTPNTLKPVDVYVCSVPDNIDFLKQLTAPVQKARCKMIICSEVDNMGDRWIQDEMEFGYTEAPHKSFPVVFDSPRNRGLQYFPFKKILGPDFGYVKREPDSQLEINSLDSFGNLEVSPPVTVNGKDYPLGRILIGSRLPMETGHRMHKVVRDFLEAQEVQAPLELYSDWLTVGHVDEFLSFVPAPNRKGFRLLLASPSACLQLFRELQRKGHGDAVMFNGLDAEQRTIDQILADTMLEQASISTQESIDFNRKLMKKELGLTEADIIDIPILYIQRPSINKADALFPNMVNMLVLGNLLGIPKPFGPVINGKCCLEENVRSLLEPLGLSCTFIDDFVPYHLNLGDVHCGTNVVRRPFTTKWWETIP
ncbi:hypothetical protein FKM82_013199 [Ascaphus truei]|uniref:protein-arginine deiminase type-1-like n=1 Tax=Ascaphus truei TaxID=8439 RepID=UPI003F5969BC